MRHRTAIASMWFLGVLLWIRVIAVSNSNDDLTVSTTQHNQPLAHATSDHRLPSTTIENRKPIIPTDGCTSINTASARQLDALPGIGPVIAQRIIEYRTANGPFSRIHEIDHVKGIGPATLRKLEGLICL